MSNFYKELLQSGRVSVWGSVMSSVTTSVAA